MEYTDIRIFNTQEFNDSLDEELDSHYDLVLANFKASNPSAIHKYSKIKEDLVGQELTVEITIYYE